MPFAVPPLSSLHAHCRGHEGVLLSVCSSNMVAAQNYVDTLLGSTMGVLHTS